MKKLILLFLLCILAGGCIDKVDLTFDRSGDMYTFSKSRFKTYAKAISKADEAGKFALIDEGYSIADSLSLVAGSSATLADFSEGMAYYFFGLKSGLADDDIYRMTLDREEKCRCLEPEDYKRLSWKRSLVDKNAPGSRIADIPLEVIGRGRTDLLSLTDRLSVIFVYGNSCKACERLSSSLVKSRIIARAAADSTINVISIYASDEDGAETSMPSKLVGWTNCTDSDCTIMYGKAFDVRLIPSIYVVTSNGIVLMRAATDVKAVEKLVAAGIPETVVIKLQPGEKVWGGRIADGDKMPYQDGFSTSMHVNSGNQVEPLLLTSSGRYVWCDAPFSFHLEGNDLVLTDLTARVETGIVGKTLSDAYRFCCRTYYGYDGQLPPDEFYKKPQYNTWIELQYNQNQKDVLKYAHGIIDHGLPAGILMGTPS